MDTKLVIISYMSSLVANLIILLGFVSVFVWFRDQANSSLIKKWRGGFCTLLGVCMLLFMHMQAWSNANLTNTMVGFHWTYLNMEIVLLFNLTIENRSRWQWLSTVGLSGLWFFGNMKVWNWTAVLLFAVVIVMELVLIWQRRWFQKNAWTYQLGLWPLAATILLMTSLIYTPQSIGGWIRQLTALFVLGIFGYGYGHALIQRINLNNLFEHRAMYDGLTKLRNFGAFDHDLEALYRNFRKTGEMYAVYEMDIDYFKRINDTYGHPAGNEVLKQVAACLNQVVTATEYEARLYRTGGEEFTVILRDIQEDSKRAEVISRQLLQSVNQLRFNFDDQLAITLSLGEERVSEKDANYLEAYKRADQYLYTSKYNGRDAITLRGKTLKRLAD